MKGVQMKKLWTWVAALVVLGPAAIAQELPKTIGQLHPGYGYEWVAASLMLKADGTPNEEFASDVFFRGLEYQEEWPCQPIIVGTPPPAESRGYFAASLLLSDVAVKATLREIVPGFEPRGNPSLLFGLSNVEPLRAQTPLPDYVLVPVKELVVGDRTYCQTSTGEATWPRRAPLPRVGDELVVIGRWVSDSVVRMGLHRHTGVLGLVDESDASIRWSFSAWMNGPQTVSSMRRHIESATESGLLDATKSIAQSKRNTPARRDLTDQIIDLQRRECEIEAVEQHNDGELSFRHTCPVVQ